MLNLRQTIEKLQKVEAKQNELNALLDNKQEEIVALSKKNVELHSSLKNYEATANDTDKLQKIISQKNAEIEYFLPIFLGGPMAPIHPVWALAAIHPWRGCRYYKRDISSNKNICHTSSVTGEVRSPF